MVTEDQAIMVLKREFENGIWPNNTIKDKSRRWLMLHGKDVYFDQTKFNKIPYIYRHEARVCFEHGEFFASISLCGALVEKILSEKLEEKNNLKIHNFSTLIDVCHAFEIIDGELKKKAHKVRKIRNSFVHPDEEKWKVLSKKYETEKDSEIIEQIAYGVYNNMNDILSHLYPLEWPPKD